MITIQKYRAICSKCTDVVLPVGFVFRNEERENELISVNSGDEFALANAINDNQIEVEDLVGNGLMSDQVTTENALEVLQSEEFKEKTEEQT